MRSRLVVVTAFAFVALGVACVDLFHGTDFETLCTRSPTDPQCGGEDASTEAEAEAEVDARRPHPDFCSWSSEEARVQASRACAWLGACEGPLGESTFGPCVVRAQLAYDCGANPSLRPVAQTDELWSCLATVKTCGDVDQCVFPNGVQPCRAVPTGSFTACTETNKAARVNCVAGPEQRAAGVEPCLMLGQTCAAEEDKTAASCSGSLAFNCTTNLCAGTAAVDCDLNGTHTFDRGIDCANVGGGACVANDAGVAPACAAGAGAPACETGPEPECEGTDVVSCVAGKRIRIECARLGLTCDASKAIPAYDPAAGCVRREPQFEICAGDDVCVGTTLKSCGRGARYEVDCAAGSVGLGTCNVVGARAACVPR